MREGWEILPFGEVCEISGGSQPPKSNFINEAREGYIRLVQVRDYRTDKFITYIPKDKAKKFCSATDIMIGRYGPPIFGIFEGIEGAYNVALMKAIPNEQKLDKEYFRWFLKSDNLIKFVEKTSKRAAGQDGVRKERLYTYPVPIPPLEEQKQIVDLLDKAFTAIDQAKANIEKNIENAKELFQSKLNDIFSQKGDGWETEFFGEVFKFRQGIQRGVKLQNEIQQEGQVRFIRIVDYTQGNDLPRYIDNPGEQYILNESDISLVRYGASTGFVCRGIKGALANNLFRVIPKDDWDINSDYLYFFLNSPVFQSFIKNKMNGAAMPAISFGMISKIPFPITTIENQIDLAQKISKIEEQSNNILDSYHQKLTNLEDLKKSILQKAFAGELTEKEVAI